MSIAAASYDKQLEEMFWNPRGITAGAIDWAGEGAKQYKYFTITLFLWGWTSSPQVILDKCEVNQQSWSPFTRP